MEPAITARNRSLFERYRTRLSIGVLFSLLVHAFILSLRLGIPGFGLPGLELPWSERRAQLPQLNVRIANPVSIAEVVQLNQALENSVVPKPQLAQQKSVDNQSPNQLPDARTRQTPMPSATNAAQEAKALQSTPALAQALRKQGSPPPEDQSPPTPARSQAKLIALDNARPSAFTLPAAELDDWWRSAPVPTSPPLPLHPTETPAPPAIAMTPLAKPLDPAKEPAPAVQKPKQQESFERPDTLQAKEPEPAKAAEIAMEQATRTEGEEIAQQEAARTQAEKEAAQRAQDLETRKLEELRKQQAEEAARLIVAQKLEEEKVAQRAAAELAAQKLAEIEKQKLEEAERQEKELEARRQAEEITRRQAIALALQKQMQDAQKQEEEAKEAAKEVAKAEQAKLQRQALELAARKQAEEAARIQAEAQAAQLESARVAAASAAAAAAAAGAKENGAADAGGANQQPGRAKVTGVDNLASKPLELTGKIAPLPAEPVFGASPAHTDDNSRRHSIFGSVDHDIGLALYIEGWRAKIERNGELNYSQSSKDKAGRDPVVTVAIRSDGSVEDIVINRSSGRADLDEAVRRIVMVNARYSIFPASMARKYDVIEIRRIWNFGDRLRLLEELE